MPVKVSLNAYFERIGFAGSIAPTVATLETLVALHAASIPFENLNPLTGSPVLLDQPALERKLLAERRGGFCFEHNTLLMRVLEDLDFSVRPLLARGLWNNPDGRKGPAGHMVLLIDINGQNYIADVGFGGLTLTAPLRLRADVEQATPHETFRLVGGAPEWTLEVKIADDWREVFAFTLDPVEPEQLVEAAQLMSRDSGMTEELRVALSPPGRRLKLRDLRLTIQPTGGEAEKRELESMEALHSVLSEEFDLALPNDERLDLALSRLFPLPPDTPDQAPL